jgi:hypothetical protein
MTHLVLQVMQDFEEGIRPVAVTGADGFGWAFGKFQNSGHSLL